MELSMNNDELFKKLIKDSKSTSLNEKAPDRLWKNISMKLKDENPDKIQHIISIILTPLNILLSSRKTLIFATTIILFITTIYIFSSPRLISVEKAGKLAMEVDNNMFIEHDKYEKEIARLFNDLSNGDLLNDDERIIVHFEKLNSIDMIILNCKSALEKNPYSTIVNTSIISAFQEKIETINHLINLKTRIS